MKNKNERFGFGIPSTFGEDLPKRDFRGIGTIGQTPSRIGLIEQGSPFDVAKKLITNSMKRKRIKDLERTAKARGQARLRRIQYQQELKRKMKRKGYVAKELGIRSV